MAPGRTDNGTTNGTSNGIDHPDMLDSTSRRPTFYKQNPHLGGKIALEEHVGSDWFNASFTYPETAEGCEGVYYHKSHLDDVVSRLVDIPERIKQMDAAGIAITALSLTSPGIQGVFHKPTAIEWAIRANNQMHKLYQTGPHAHRFRTWGSVALQDPQAAAKEAERCVKELGCIGILINGYTNIGTPDDYDIRYLDEAVCDPFWAKLSELDVPLYLHPRIAMPGQTRSLKGYEFLAGSPWGFARETAEHCLRLMCSGLFDKYPNLRVVLGHCGEGLPFAIDRTDHRLRHFNEGGLSNHQRPLCYYFANNFWLTTAGVQKQSVMESCIREVGIDRVLFSMDYPMEDMQETAEWFDGLEMDAASRAKLAYGNAKILLRIK